jgi:hypothetical protein
VNGGTVFHAMTQACSVHLNNCLDRYSCGWCCLCGWHLNKRTAVFKAILQSYYYGVWQPQAVQSLARLVCCMEARPCKHDCAPVWYTMPKHNAFIGTTAITPPILARNLYLQEHMEISWWCSMPQDLAELEKIWHAECEKGKCISVKSACDVFDSYVLYCAESLHQKVCNFGPIKLLIKILGDVVLTNHGPRMLTMLQIDKRSLYR